LTRKKKSKLIDKKFKEIDKIYADLKNFMKNLKAFGYNYDECDSKNMVKNIEVITEHLKMIWKLVNDLDQENDSLMFDIYLDSINDYKIQILHLITGIRDALKNSVDSSNCRNSTSTTESKTLFNTRRETTQMEMERRNDSIILKPNIFLNLNISSKPKDKREGLLKIIEK